MYRIKQKVNCQSSYIVYLGTCKKYVGKSTQPFTRRHSGHKQEIKNKIGGLGQHYGGQQGCGYENLKMMIIEKVENGRNGMETVLNFCIVSQITIVDNDMWNSSKLDLCEHIMNSKS